MERDELIEEISRRKGIAMEEVAEILDEEDAICLEVHAWNNHNLSCRCSVCPVCP